jgi:hypothetical protein
MATNVVNGNINYPRVSFLDPITGMPALPWLLWLQNPSFVSLNVQASTITGNETITGTITAYGGISGGTF